MATAHHNRLRGSSDPNSRKRSPSSSPDQSGYGWHLVFVDTVIPGRVPAFEEVEQDVKTAWLGKRKQEAWRKAYEKIRSKYTVLLPVPADDASNPASGPISPAAARPRDDGAPL